MQITKELLLARKEEAEKQRQQMIANMGAIQGVIGELEYWLGELDKEEAPATPPPADPAAPAAPKGVVDKALAAIEAAISPAPAPAKA